MLIEHQGNRLKFRGDNCVRIWTMNENKMAERGYKEYLSTPARKIPKVTAWRRRKSGLDFDGNGDCNISTLSSADEELTEGSEPGQEINHDNEYGPCGLDLIDFERVDYNFSVRDDHDDVNEPALNTENTCHPEEYYADDETDEIEIGQVEGVGQEKKDHEDLESDSEPLYPGARISISVSMLLMMSFSMRHGLSGQALADLLVLIELHCIVPNMFNKTIQMFNNYFRDLSSPIEYHYYCCTCFTYIGLRKSCCPCCKGLPGDKQHISYFIIIPIIYQLQSLFADQNLVERITRYKKKWLNKTGSNTDDVLDGQVYKENFSKIGYFRSSKPECNELHISFQLNTDGVSIFRSSNFSIWPVYLIINEIPPDERFSRNNRIFAGLWFGYSKPSFKAFLKPLAESIKIIHEEGFFIQEDSIRVKGLLLSGVFDSPARSLFQNFVQFNGFYGCPYCLNPGETYKPSAKGCTHIYPFNLKSKTGTALSRTHEDTLKTAKLADQNCFTKPKAIQGIKGSSWSMLFQNFDIIRGISLDYMHCVCLGVMKMLMSLWFDKTYRNESYSISNKSSEVDDRLTKIKPPYIISRLPRPLSDLSHYKAAELKNFLLFYGVPCLWGILPEDAFQHFLLLVESIYLLLGSSISQKDLEKAQKMLIHFCLNVAPIYNKRYQTSNIHLLLHAVEKVKDLGPLWCNSCFYFEDFNGQLRKLFHGTQKIEMQISLAVCINQKIPGLARKLQYGTCEYDFYHNLSGRSLASPQEYISIGTGILGQIVQIRLDKKILHAVEIFVRQGQVKKSWTFTRALINGKVVHSASYVPVTRRNSYTVQVKDCLQKYAQIQFFLKLDVNCPNLLFCCSTCRCQKSKFLAVVNYFDTLPIQVAKDDLTGTCIPHLVPVKLNTSDIYVIDILKIQEICLITKSASCDFVSTMPNKFEKE